MNEQIKQLALQADKYCRETVPNWTMNDYNKKFAELLILECIDLVETTPRHCAFTTYDLSTVECTIQKSSERLHEHFGLQRKFRTTGERQAVKEISNTRRSL